jgi:hypothetical protein
MATANATKRMTPKALKPPKPPKTPKTQKTTGDVAAFFAALGDATRADCVAIDDWMAQAAGPGAMYGKAIVGYGSKVIRYADGREVPWMMMGLSPRKHALTLYGLLGAGARAEALLAKLGKHTTGKGCLYVKRLADVDAQVLKKLIALAARR